MGAAQSRYLWILLVAGIFYLSLGLAAAPLDHVDGDQVSMPILGLELSPTAVWASGPAVLSLLVLVVIGSIRAVGVARKALGVPSLGSHGEAFDASPNAIDLAAYSTEKTPLWLQWILGLSYPAYLTFFVLQAGLHLVALWRLAPSRTWVIVVATPSTLLTAWAAGMTLWFWRHRLPAPSDSKS